MAIDAQAAFTNTNNIAFPDTESVNATGPTATDGTEFVKVLLDNYNFGRQQALLDYGGLIPSGVAEAAGAGNSQEIEALQKSFGHPGEFVAWFGNNDPGSLGLRVLLMNGQGILVTNYAELLAAVYVGDGDNATANSFFRADDAGGAVRNIAGAYLILPDARGRVIRAADDTGLIDPDGLTRLPGDVQEDAFQGHWHELWRTNGNDASAALADHNPNGSPSVIHDTPDDRIRDAATDGVNGVPRTAVETRMKNISVHFAIRY